MDFRPIFFIIGLLMLGLAASMSIPMIVDLYSNDKDWIHFLMSILITLFFASLLLITNRGVEIKISIRQGFVLTVLSWVVLVFFASLPLSISSDIDLSFTDAFFETMSAMTTTGATTIVGLDSQAPGILLWRAIMQWIGAMGFVVMAISLFPFLRVGGMQLFATESSEKEKQLPRTSQIGQSILSVSCLLTAIVITLYFLAGMNFFDAFCHGLTTIATGGLANYDASFAHFNSATIEIIACIFMLVGAIPFLIHYKFLFSGQKNAYNSDEQIKTFLCVCGLFILAITLQRILFFQVDAVDALRSTAFNVISVMTTTGYATQDYMQWGVFSVICFFVLSFLGGCAGSTTAGLKSFRLRILGLIVATQSKQLLHPHGVFVPTYNKKPIQKETMIAVASYLFVFLLIFFIGALALSLTGLDFITAFSGSIAALGNIGPGLGPQIGPAGNYAAINDTAKWILAFLMLIGRLDLFTVLVLLSPHFWQK
jgi:trk system potassium uptake protein